MLKPICLALFCLSLVGALLAVRTTIAARAVAEPAISEPASGIVPEAEDDDRAPLAKGDKLPFADFDSKKVSVIPIEAAPIEKVSIIISKGSLEGIYPGLIMANGARMDGIDADVFFTFFGLDAIRLDRHDHVKVATVGNPGLHMPTLIGALPGLSALATRMMQRQMETLDIPPIPEFIELLSDSGAGLYACRATVDMFGLTMEDFVPQVNGILTVGEFYGLAAGSQVIFT